MSSAESDLAVLRGGNREPKIDQRFELRAAGGETPAAWAAAGRAFVGGRAKGSNSDRLQFRGAQTLGHDRRVGVRRADRARLISSWPDVSPQNSSLR